MVPDSPLEILEGQIRECFGKVAYAHKAHEKCADITLTGHKRIKIVQIGFSALITTGLLVIIFGDIRWVEIVTAILSTLLLGLNTYTKGDDRGEKAQKHSDTASDLWNIRESYLSLITDIRSGNLNLEEAGKRRDRLQEELAAAYKGAPRTTAKAYKRAAEALKVKEELTFSDEEIDRFLPINLRRNTIADNKPLT